MFNISLPKMVGGCRLTSHERWNPSFFGCFMFFFWFVRLQKISHSRYFWAWFKMQCACNSCWDITVHVQLLLNQSTTHLTSPSLKNISTCLVNLLFASYSKQFGFVNGDAKFVLIPRNECQSLPANIHWPWINHTILLHLIASSSSGGLGMPVSIENNAVAQTTLLGLTHHHLLVNHLWRLIKNYWTRSKVSSFKHPSFSWTNNGGSFQYPWFPINALLASLSCQYQQSIPSLKRHKRKPPCNTWNKIPFSKIYCTIHICFRNGIKWCSKSFTPVFLPHRIHVCYM